MALLAGINHVAFLSADIDRLKEFYKRVFDAECIVDEIVEHNGAANGTRSSTSQRVRPASLRIQGSDGSTACRSSIVDVSITSRCLLRPRSLSTRSGKG